MHKMNGLVKGAGRAVLLCLPLILGLPRRGDAQLVELQKNCEALSLPGHYPDYRGIPRYSIERQEVSVAKPPVLLLRISVSTESIEEGAMTRLACKLSSEFRSEAAIDALIFDDKQSARNLALGFTDQAHYGNYLWHLRARYELDRKSKRQFIEFVLPTVEDRLLSLRRFKIWITGGG